MASNDHVSFDGCFPPLELDGQSDDSLVRKEGKIGRKHSRKTRRTMSGAILGPKTADALLVSSDRRESTDPYQPGNHARKAEANASDIELVVVVDAAANPSGVPRPSSSSSRSSLLPIPSSTEEVLGLGAGVAGAGGVGGTNPNHSLWISAGRSRTYSSARVSILFSCTYIETHCCSGPRRVSILLRAWRSCGRRRTSILTRIRASASFRSVRPGIPPDSAFSPLSRLDKATTASDRFWADKRPGMELNVESQELAALRMCRVRRRLVRSECRVERVSTAGVAVGSPTPPEEASFFLPPRTAAPRWTLPLPPPPLPPPLLAAAGVGADADADADPTCCSRPEASSAIPPSPCSSRVTSALQRGRIARSSAPIRPISSWQDCVCTCKRRASSAIRDWSWVSSSLRSAKRSPSPSCSSAVCSCWRATLRYAATEKLLGDDRMAAAFASAGFAAAPPPPLLVRLMLAAVAVVRGGGVGGTSDAELMFRMCWVCP